MKLIIAEKPSLARTVAKVIGIIKDNSKSGGHIECNNGYIVTWVFGHILELWQPQDYNEKFKSWSVDLLPIVPNIWQYHVKSDAKSQFNNIKTLLKSATMVINCGDPDREGQLLIDELLLYLQVKLPIKRLLILDPKDMAISKALDNMEENSKYFSWYQAGLLRLQADWLIGMNMTRAFTQLGSRINMQGVVSVGRVQTPTLKLIYDRYLAIQNYKPLNFYNFIAEFTTNTAEVFTAKLDLKATGLSLDEEGRLLHDSELKIINEKINGKLATICEYEVKAEEIPPPKLFILSDLQAIANAKLGLSADETLKNAQSLYERQLITYPRTACAYLPESLHADAEKILNEIGTPYHYINQNFNVNKIDPKIKSKAFDDSKLGGESHFAIIPTGYMKNVNMLQGYELDLFNIICIQYIFQFLPNIKVDKTNGVVNCEGYKFNFSGKVINSLGWKELQDVFNDAIKNEKQYTSEESGDHDAESQKLPQLSLNQNVKNTFNNNIQKSTTTKPKLYTEGALIKTMANIHNLLDGIVKSYYRDECEAKSMVESYKRILKDTAGLGTEATRAGIIKTLKTRNFIANKGKSLEITDKGIDFMKYIASDVNLIKFSQLTSPITTAIYEQKLDNVLNHKLEATEFYNNIVDELLYPNLNSLKEMINILPTPLKSKQSVINTGKKCPECACDLVERAGKFGKFIACSGYPKCKWVPPRPDRPSPLITDKKCPSCRTGVLVKRKGAKGEFLGCNKFPNCKHIDSNL